MAVCCLSQIASPPSGLIRIAQPITKHHVSSNQHHPSSILLTGKLFVPSQYMKHKRHREKWPLRGLPTNGIFSVRFYFVHCCLREYQSYHLITSGCPCLVLLRRLCMWPLRCTILPHFTKRGWVECFWHLMYKTACICLDVTRDTTSCPIVR